MSHTVTLEDAKALGSKRFGFTVGHPVSLAYALGYIDGLEGSHSVDFILIDDYRYAYVDGFEDGQIAARHAAYAAEITARQEAALARAERGGYTPGLAYDAAGNPTYV
jgi:hypothetical protein